ncbi:MAG TPA: hypothetical protein PLY68_11370, partial [Myxococcota bacterium]|nr:hypothetical protein [Myxococcota bacterium]HQP96778.1 hypothetical protein [Myxococcota bacterium]
MFCATSPRHSYMVISAFLFIGAFAAIVGVPSAAEAQDPTHQNEQLQEFDLNYSEDGTAPDRRYQMKPYEEYH